MDFVKVVAPVRDVEIEDIGVLVPKGMSRVVCGEDLARTEDLWDLLRRGELLQILSKFSRPLKSETLTSLESESAGGSSPDLTADVERRLDAVIEDMRPSTSPPSVPNALRKLVDDTKDVAAPSKQHKRKGKR